MIDYLKTKQKNGLTPVEDPLFSISKMADDFGVCCTTLRIRFKKSTGRLPRSVIEDMRLEKFHSLLKEGFSGKGKELAELCGYNSTQSLINMIKKRTGLTITELKKSYQS